jgi:hypothetical protein
MSRPRLVSFLRIAGGIAAGGSVLLVIALFLFFRYMSEGELSSWPTDRKITVAFSDGDDVYRVMTDICKLTENVPSLRREEYQRLLDAGTLAQVPNRTPILLERRGYSGNGLMLSSFRFENGQWKGRRGWTCPNSVVLKRAYP